MSVSKTVFSLLFCTAVALSVHGSRVAAEEKAATPDDEAAIEAKEEAAGDSMMGKEKTLFSGVAVLDVDTPADKVGVIGKFADADGKIYILRSASEKITKSIIAANGKKVTISGKLRVNGKYLVAMAVIASNPAGTRDTQKPNGF